MKVIHLISGGDTGGARTHVHLLLKLLNQDHSATLVCFTDGPFAQDAAALGIPTVVLRGSLPAALRQLRRMIRDGGYELVHCHGSRGNLMGALLKPGLGLPVITTVHSDPRLDYLGRPAARLVYGSLNAFALRRMDDWIGVSDAMRDLLIQRGCAPDRVFAIYNGVEFTRPARRDETARLAYLRALGLDADADSVVVGIAARMDPVKDLSTLLRGFAKACAVQPRLRLLIAGEGQEREALEALARELGIAAVTCFAGWRDDMPDFYRALDINVLTSLSETFPYALTEGAREALPAVSTRVGGVPKLISDGETGYLIEPGDAEALGTRLAELAADPQLRQTLGRALYEKAARDFSAQATCRRQLEIYRGILTEWKRRHERGRSGVLVCGAYGMYNAGDEAVLDAVLGEMRAIDPFMPLTVLSRDPSETAATHGVRALHSFRVLSMLRRMRRSELFLSGGGSLIQDVTSSRSLWYYLWTLMAAKRCGCRVLMYGCGVGPVLRAGNRRRAGRVINRCVDAVTLRESGSLETLRALGVTKPDIALAAEPALGLAPAPDAELDRLFQRLGIPPAARCFCVCVRRWPGIGEKLPLFAAAARHVWARYGLTPVLLSVNPKQDGETVSALRALLGPDIPCHLVTEPMRVPELIGFIARMEGILSMRLHVLIFAASQAIPMAGVSYDPKVASFLDYVEARSYLDYAALARPEQLLDIVDAALGADRAALRAATDRLLALERRNGAAARRLLEEGRT
ncbi:MAG: polysaccharide pyruvyl transferase CsaB [Oscillospiraceae bacterium]|nr:polysaccharide pyruvyl transferase CsaB [Oscillospiraceae bacterium]